MEETGRNTTWSFYLIFWGLIVEWINKITIGAIWHQLLLYITYQIYIVFFYTLPNE